MNFTKFKVSAIALILALNVSNAKAQITVESSTCKENEMNNNQKTATWMPKFYFDNTSMYISVVNGILSSGKDQDWFRFHTDAGGTYKVIVGGLDGYRTDITKTNGKKLTAYSSNGKYDQEFTLDADETYFIKVSYTSVPAPREYSLRVEAPEMPITASTDSYVPVVVSPISVDVAQASSKGIVVNAECNVLTTSCSETESNDNQKSANGMPVFLDEEYLDGPKDLTFKSTINGELSSSKDQDWFKFTTGDGGKYTVTVCGLDGFRSDVTKSNGTKMTAYSSNGKYIQEFTLDANAEYYIKVSYTKLPSAKPYTLEISTQDANVSTTNSCRLFTVPPPASVSQSKSNVAMLETMNKSVKVGPNPSNASFKLSNIFDQTIQLRIFDITGKVIENGKSVTPGATYEFGNSYQPGVYMVEIMNNNKREIIRLVKQ